MSKPGEQWQPPPSPNAGRFRLPRVMPQWVKSSNNGRVGPPPPPPPSGDAAAMKRSPLPSKSPMPDPDYEVIDFPNQQYMNANQPPNPAKPKDSRRCDLCGSSEPNVRCLNCNGQMFCASCDGMYHRHPKRQTHVRKMLPVLDQENVLPPLPPKGITTPPVPPPRRNKVSGGRKMSTQSLQMDRSATMSRMMTRPLPAVPVQQNQNHPAANNVPSEKDVSMNTALQQRYKRHLDMMRGTAPDLSRDFSKLDIQTKPILKPDMSKSPVPNNDRWNTLPHHRSERQFPMSNETDLRPPMSPTSDRFTPTKRSPISASVFDLHAPPPPSPHFFHQHQQQPFNPMMQAQSMAQLGCMNCHPQMGNPQDWPQWNRRYGSNMSLNMSPDSMGQQPMWMGPWMPMYPPPMMHPGMQHMHSSSRVPSRANSRAPSPTASVRSRRSRVSRRPLDEDTSDVEEDRKSYLRRGSTKSERHMDRVETSSRPARSVTTWNHEATNGSVVSKSQKQTKRVDNSDNRSVAKSFQAQTAADSSDVDENVISATPDVLEAPPPPTPEHQWICEHCTFVNEGGVRVCEVCCKTPTAPPEPPPDHLPPKGRKVSSSESCIYEYSDAEHYHRRKRQANKQAPKAAPESDSNDESMSNKRGVTRDQNANIVNNSNIQTKDSSDDARKSQPKTRVVKKRNQGEKKSTGCGPSPPRDIERANSVKSFDMDRLETMSISSTVSRKKTTSTGTSPLPQSISTQTYDILENVKKIAPSKVDSSENTDTKPTEVESTRKPVRRSLRRSSSLHGSRPTRDVDQWTNSQKSDRSLSRLSYSSDSHSLPPSPPREKSPSPYNRYEDAMHGRSKHINSLGPRHRSNSMMMGNEMGMGHPTAYRSIVDLHRPDLYRDDGWRSPYDSYHMQNQRNDYGMYRGESQPRDMMGIDYLMQRRQSDVMKSQSMELIKLLREAESNNFTPEELQIAMTTSGNQNPIVWLKENWSNMVETVYTVATNYGRESKENTVGTISQREGREALRKHKGSVWKAVTECVEQRQKKFKEIDSRGKFTREDILTCLTAHHGDLEAAFLELSKTQLKPFLMRIWGPPAGAENECGNVPQGSESGAGPMEKKEDSGLSISLSDYIKAHADQATLNQEDMSEENRLVSYLKSMHIDQYDSEAPLFFGDSSEAKEESPSINLLNDLRDLIQKVNENQSDGILKDIGNIMNNERPETPEESIVEDPPKEEIKEIVLDIRRGSFSEENYNEETIDDFHNSSMSDVSTFYPIIRTTLNNTTKQVCKVSNPVEIRFLEEPRAPEENTETKEESEESDSSESSSEESESESSSESEVESERAVTENIKSEEAKVENIPEDNIPSIENNVKDSEEANQSSEININVKAERSNVNKSVKVGQNKKKGVKESHPKTSIDQNQIQDANNVELISRAEASTSSDSDSKSNQNDPNSDGQKRPQHLVEIVEDTQRLIQQMRDEIKSDIASFESNSSSDEEESNDYDMSDSSAVPASSVQEQSPNDMSSDSDSEYLSDNIEEEEDEESSEDGDEEESTDEADISNFHEESMKDISELHGKGEMLSEILDANVSLDPKMSSANMNTFDDIMQNLQEQIDSIDDRVTHVSNIGFVQDSIENARSPDLEIVLTPIRTEEVNMEQSMESIDFMDNDEIANDPIVLNKIAESMLNVVEDQASSIAEAAATSDLNTAENTVTIEPEVATTSDLKTTENAEATVESTTAEVAVILNHEIVESVTTVTPAPPAEQIVQNSNIADVSSNEQPAVSNKEAVAAVEQGANAQVEATVSTSKVESNTNGLESNIEKPTSDAKQSAEPSNAVSTENTNAQPDTTVTVKLNNKTSNKQTKKAEINNNNLKTAPSKPAKSFVSQIPKLDKNQGGKANEPKVTTKVPDKQPIKPFGSFPMGHVKMLQQGLLSKTNASPAEKQAPKIPVPISTTKRASVPKVSVSASPDAAKGSNTAKAKEETKKAGKVGTLKPYFLETCLSDDYFTDEDAKKPKPATKSNVKKTTPAPVQSEPSEQTEPNVKQIDFSTIKFLEESPERQIRMLLAEGILPSWEQAEVAIGLHEMKYDEETALQAASECTTLEAALAYLQQECELCTGRYPMKNMISMLKCTHRCCKECAKNYFTIQVTDRSIFDCTCAFCKLPQLQDLDEDEVLEYFSNLDILLKSILDENVHELFQRKLRDRTLMQDPNFKWCVECSSGFIANPRQKRLICPDCRSITCASCRKPWEPQHEGITCEQFAEWKEGNDPENQVVAVKKHLDDHGIDCPKCRFRFALSRGGCMHFTCTQCKYEFCCGCGKAFMMGAKCGVSPYCAKLGLHSHHPRNCLFYLRDKEPHQLQTLLKLNEITFKTDELIIPAEGADINTIKRCPVQLQRETPNGLVDSICHADVPKNHGGLCTAHYVEYLVGLMRAIDPLPVMDLSEMVAELRRLDIPLPERGPWDTDPIYTEMCSKIIKEKIPLD